VSAAPVFVKSVAPALLHALGVAARQNGGEAVAADIFAAVRLHVPTDALGSVAATLETLARMLTEEHARRSDLLTKEKESRGT